MVIGFKLIIPPIIRGYCRIIVVFGIKCFPCIPVWIGIAMCNVSWTMCYRCSAREWRARERPWMLLDHFAAAIIVWDRRRNTVIARTTDACWVYVVADAPAKQTDEWRRGSCEIHLAALYWRDFIIACYIYTHTHTRARARAGGAFVPTLHAVSVRGNSGHYFASRNNRLNEVAIT